MGVVIVNKKQLFISLIVLLTMMVLAACGGNEENAPDNNDDTENNTTNNTEEHEDAQSDEDTNSYEKDHSDMDPSSTGEVPENLADEADPTYPVDSEAEINADHMEGMDGAIATIDGAYDTTVYTVTYTPTTGGEKVKDHKWVIHEEIEDAEDEPYEEGEEVVLNADHMEGMDGATATIDSAEDTTVYMVSYTDTETDEEVSYHKWVTEEELSPVE